MLFDYPSPVDVAGLREFLRRLEAMPADDPDVAAAKAYATKMLRGWEHNWPPRA